MGRLAALSGRIIKKLHEREFQRYLAVGLFGIILFEGTFFALNHYLIYQVSYVISFESITVVNFLMHDTITFRNRKHYTMTKRFVIYESQAIVYRIIQYALFFVFSLYINLYIALLIAVFIAFFYSYGVNKSITWRSIEEK